MSIIPFNLHSPATVRNSFGRVKIAQVLQGGDDFKEKRNILHTCNHSEFNSHQRVVKSSSNQDINGTAINVNYTFQSILIMSATLLEGWKIAQVLQG